MIDATRSETDQEIINAYWRGYNDACNKMKKINDNIKELTTVLNVAEKTFGFEMEQVKAEDIPDIISIILEKVAKQKVKVEGNGISKNMAVKVLENKIKYLNRCRCGALLEFEYDDVRFSEVGKFCYEDTVGYITCPSCHKDVYLGSVNELYKLKKEKM